MSDEIIVEYNAPGHVCEFTVNLPGYDLDRYIPEQLTASVSAQLSPWSVVSRGSRLEVTHSCFRQRDGDEFADRVHNAVANVAREHYGRPVGVIMRLNPYVAPTREPRKCPWCTETFNGIRDVFAHAQKVHRES